MLAIRLARVGAKKKPAYRVVVIEKSRARNSSSLEIVGHYNPTKDPIHLLLKRERIDYWVGQGAQPSKTVARLMRYEPPEPVEEAPAKADAPAKAEPAAEAKAAEPTAEAEPVADAQAEPAAQEAPAAAAPEAAAESAAEEPGTAEAEPTAESDVAAASEPES